MTPDAGLDPLSPSLHPRDMHRERRTLLTAAAAGAGIGLVQWGLMEVDALARGGWWSLGSQILILVVAWTVPTMVIASLLSTWAAWKNFRKWYAYAILST